MIVGAAVCPGAPFLIDGTADAIAICQQSVALACAEAVSRLPPADLTLLISSTNSAAAGGRGWRLLPPGTRIATAALRRSDLPDRHAPRLAFGGAGGAPEPVGDASEPVGDPAVGTMVGAYLLQAAERRPRELIRTGHGPGAAEHDRPARVATQTAALEVAGDPAGSVQALSVMLNSAQRIALLVIADGSACHGDAAPGRRDDRADPFDAALARALESGDPAALQAATADRGLARELMAVVAPLSVLAGLTASRAPDEAELLYSAAPLGVGYLVASWQWAPS